MSDDKAATIEDIDKANATVTVAEVPAEGSPPAADSAQAAPVAAPTEAQDGADPGAEPPKPKEGDEPEWFKKRLKDFSRQRRNAERDAETARAETEQLRKQLAQLQQQPPKQSELNPNDFPNYAAYDRAVAREEATKAAQEVVSSAVKASAEREAELAQQRAKQTFLEKAQAQAEEADIDLDAVMETLSVQPLVSQAVVDYLAESEVPAKLAEHLAFNPDKLHRISMMGPTLAKRELAKEEAAFKAAAPKPPSTKAPPPPPRVGGRGATIQSVENMDMKDFAAFFHAQEKAKVERH